MTNINPAPSQINPNEPMMPSVNAPGQQPLVTPQPSMTSPKLPVSTEQPTINRAKNSGNGSNKMWIIFLVFLAMIICFWIGYFTNAYFFQESHDQFVEPPFSPVITEPFFEPDPQLMDVNKEFIFFRGEENYLNDGLNFDSQEQCVEDEIATLTAIEDDSLTIQISEWIFQEDTGEYIPQVIDYQVEDGACLLARPICMDVFIDRCFSLENIDGVYHLDYEFMEVDMMSTPEDFE